MSDLRQLQSIYVEVSAARGASFADIARRTGAFGALPSDSDDTVQRKFADYAITQNPGFQSVIPGPSNNTRANLATLKSASPTDLTSLYDGHVWFFDQQRNYTGLWDDVMYVRSNSGGTGAWVRQVQAITPQLWMTPQQRALWADGQLPDVTTALQRAVEFCTGSKLSSLQTGRKLHIPGGRYYLLKPLVMNFRDVVPIVDDGDMRRITIEGDGRANTEIFYAGPSGASFTGSVSGTTLSVSAVATGELHVGANLAGSGIADDTTIIGLLTGTGGAGTYKLSKPASLSSRAMTSQSAALYIGGHQDNPNGGVDLHFSLAGVRLQRDINLQTAVGIRTTRMSDLLIDDVSVYNFATNLDLVDTIRIDVDRSKIGGALVGVDLRSDIYSQPNVVRFSRTDFGGNAKRVMRVRQGSNVELTHCGLEGNGDGTQPMIFVEGGPVEGGASFICRALYSENNHGLATIEINFTNGGHSGTIDISGNTLRRNSADRCCANEVLVFAEGMADLRVTLAANGFNIGPDYVPSPGRPVVRVSSGSSKARLFGLGSNMFGSQLERPDLSSMIAEGYGYDETLANARVTASGSATIFENIASVNKTDTGVYRLLYKVQPRSPTVIAVANLVGAVGTARLTSENIAYAEISTFDAAGNPADLGFTVYIKGLLS